MSKYSIVDSLIIVKYYGNKASLIFERWPFLGLQESKSMDMI